MSDANKTYPTEKPYRARRAPFRASYEAAVVHPILDAALVAHVAYESDAGPHVIPMFFARDGEALLMHVSAKSGTALAARRGARMCLTVTHVDALVFARSAFHHSVRYRSVVVHGVPEIVEGDAKRAALDLMIDRLSAGRSALVRPANAQEYKATSVLRLPLEQVAAKVSNDMKVVEEPEDMDIPVWAGLLPVRLQFGALAEDDAVLTQDGRPALEEPLFKG